MAGLRAQNPTGHHRGGLPRNITRAMTRGAQVSKLPGGTVTFVFTDIEGSTRLLNSLGPTDEPPSPRSRTYQSVASSSAINSSTVGGRPVSRAALH